MGSGPIVPALRQLTVCYTVMFPMDEDYAGFDDLARARERMFHDGHTANLLEMSVGMVHYSPFEDQVWAWVLGSLERFPFLYMPEMDQIRKWAEVLHAQLNRKWFDTRRKERGVVMPFLKALELRKTLREMEEFDFASGDVNLLYRGRIPTNPA